MPTSRPRIFLALAVLVACAGAVAGTYLYKAKAAGLEAPSIPALVNQLPSDAPALVYIDVAAIRALNPQALTNVLETSNTKGGDNEYQRFVRETGFDYSRDLDRLAIAFWPASPGPASAPNAHGPAAPARPAQPVETPIFLLADGRFDRSKIEAYASRSGQIENEGQVKLYKIAGDPPVAMRFLSDSEIEMASGKDAVRRFDGNDPSGPSASIRELVRRVSESPLFAVADAAPFSNDVASANNTSLPSPASFAKDLRAVTFEGKPAGGGFDLVFKGKCDSASSAAGLAGLLNLMRGFGSAALADPKSRGQMTKEQADSVTEMLAQIKIQQEETWVGITVHITPELIAAAEKQASTAPPHETRPSRP